MTERCDGLDLDGLLAPMGFGAWFAVGLSVFLGAYTLMGTALSASMPPWPALVAVWAVAMWAAVFTAGAATLLVAVWLLDGCLERGIDRRSVLAITAVVPACALALGAGGLVFLVLPPYAILALLMPMPRRPLDDEWYEIAGVPPRGRDQAPQRPRAPEAAR